TFIFPASNPSANYRNRIFTPGGEIAFAGHPSIGTAYVAAQEGLVPHPDGSSVIYQELEIGVLPLELICEGGQVRKVIMTQGEPAAAVHARAFAPGLGVEDPATGSAAGACGAYLAAHGKLPAPTFIVEQGMEIHHASRIEVSVETEDGKPKVIRVGGQVAPLIRGTLRLP